MLCRSVEVMKDVTRQAGCVELPNEEFLKEVCALIAEGRDVTLRVRGISMRPFLEDRRDKIVLTRPGVVKVGDAVLAEIAPGKFVFHRIIRIEGTQVTLKGDGNVYAVEQCGIQNIVASAKVFVRKERCYSPQSRVWRWYSAMWPHDALLRRVLLAIHRRLPQSWR